MLNFLRQLFPSAGDRLAYQSAKELARSAQRNVIEFARMNAALEREIEERKLIEKALKDERHLFRTLMDNLPDQIYFKDIKGRYMRNSKAHLSLLGLKHANDALYKTDFDFLTEERARKTFENEQRVMDTGQAITIDEIQPWPDGTVIWASTTIMPFRDEEGKIIGTFGISRDITRRKHAEDELQLSKEELEQRVQQRTEELQATTKELQTKNIKLMLQVTETLNEKQNLENSLKESSNLRAALDEHAIVAVTNPQGIITSVNDKFCAVSKYSREELIGQDHRIVNSGFHPKNFMRDMWASIGHGKVWKGEFRNRAKDGTCFWIETTIVPSLNAEGKPYQYITISTDITKIKSAEEALMISLREKEDQLNKDEHRK